LNGVVFFAHPRFLHLRKADKSRFDKASAAGKTGIFGLKIERLRDSFSRFSGLIDGVEVYHPNHEPQMIQRLLDFVAEQNKISAPDSAILVSVASDYHGSLHGFKEIGRDRGIALAEGHKEARVGYYISPAIGTDYSMVAAIKQRAAQKSKQEVTSGSKSHPAGMDEPIGAAASSGYTPGLTIEAKAFGDMDIRAKAQTVLTDETVERLNIGFAYLTRARFSSKLAKGILPTIVVGADARRSSPRVRQATIKGLIEGGVNVIDIGFCSTPLLYFAVK
ncbi:MAG: hypothetical protein NT033_06915, partial [Candidatus Omnitrophica bacterium]|nr:hypothetical protein [Candidatus Omnitrophota bacterium]